MPQQTDAGKKKRKGRAPAHQNKFAFAHNPKSKTTAKILASPNIHVCRRCHDKIEWRKQYRKYKPRTQPGTCNGCKKRNVTAAYHTLCESCTRSSAKAKELFAATMKEEETPETMTDGEAPSSATSAGESLSAPAPAKWRACAVCVKELALPDSGDEEDESDLAERMGRIRLRERKAIERKLEREAKEARKAARLADGDNDDGKEDDSESDEGDDDSSNDFSNDDHDDDDDDDDDDPFLKAVGGADKLLTGKAYQEKLLAEQNQRLRLET